MNRCVKVIPLLILTTIALVPAALAQGAGSVFKYSFVSPNLYCLDFGYYDAARAAGIAGFDVNPAGLSGTKHVSWATAFSTSKRADARIGVQIVPDSFYFGKVVLPVDLGFQETGGWDFLGAAGKVGPLSFGVGFRRGDMVGAIPSIDTSINQYWSGQVPYILSHAVFPQIPANIYIPVLVTVSGSGYLHFNIHDDSASGINSVPITVGTALDLGPTSFGLGATMNVMKGRAGITGRGEGIFQNVTGTMTSMPYVTNWKVDIDFSGSVVDSTLYAEDFYGSVTGTQFVVRAGNQTRIKNLILGELVLGAVVEEAFPTTFSGGFTNHIKYASGLPASVLFDTSKVNLVIDLIHFKITGTVKAELTDFAKTEGWDTTANPLKFSPQTNCYAAGVYRLAPWEFNLGAGMTGFLPAGQGWGRIYFDGGIKLHRFIDWHLGAVCAWQRYRIASYQVTTPPIVVAGLGGEARLFGVGLDFAVRTNTTAMILQAISATQHVELVKFNLLDWTSFGLGLKFDL